ncbi:MAG: glycosyltransferase family 2 protein [Terrisporobacter othiniensis]|uniref:glycosyltransferase family 2 protein n=1 Tax=Terrisporobacter othiniensis TaxID=1577792 RepID=UPI00093F2442|nr:glycosyltransferase family 2 protein [Terrisporobacter othiniensis]MDU6983133.1 glycosyltransferase family 2 protein [Terrisporobacter othiniensis]
MNKIDVSIIVPVYNNEEYLDECIESIMNQTFKNIEVILVNDGSTDESGWICNNYAKKDNRVVVIHSENNGVSIARNIGINNARGNYIIFCDSDDWIENDYVEVLYNEIINNNTDAVYCGIYRDVYKDRRLIKNEASGVSRNMYIEKQNLDKYLKYIFETMLGPFLASWGKIYDTKIIKENNLQFDSDMIFHEDFDFNIRYLKQCKSIYITKEIKYHFRMIDGVYGLQKRNKYNVIYEISKFYSEINSLIEKLPYNKELNDYIQLLFIEYYKLVFQKLIMSEPYITVEQRNEVLYELSKDREFCTFINVNRDKIKLYRYIKFLIDKKLYGFAYFIIRKRIY